eukprot:GHRQ01030553.1.p2 GENE.GHRQ01030553.1~~GHRQ01030553.1.p2  ORF type:complete len:103 (+),score=2.73 GHRQ01030553.1:174-482(+)
MRCCTVCDQHHGIAMHAEARWLTLRPMHQLTDKRAAMDAFDRVLNLQAALFLEVLVDLDAGATLADRIVVAVAAPSKLHGAAQAATPEECRFIHDMARPKQQ